MKKSKFTESQIRLNPGYFHVLMCFLLSARQIEARTCDHLIMSHKHLKYSFICKDTENIGILELHVIPNVCSGYSEHKFSQMLA